MIGSLKKEIERLTKIIANPEITTTIDRTQPKVNKKEEDLLKLAASLIVKIVLKRRCS